MIAEARRLNPGLRFEQGTMLALDIGDEHLGRIAACYSIVNVPREAQLQAFAELWRVLRPGGFVLLAFHVGDEDVHLEEWWDSPIAGPPAGVRAIVRALSVRRGDMTMNEVGHAVVIGGGVAGA